MCQRLEPSRSDSDLLLIVLLIVRRTITAVAVADVLRRRHLHRGGPGVVCNRSMRVATRESRVQHLRYLYAAGCP